jgi:hypothetical protein
LKNSLSYFSPILSNLKKKFYSPFALFVTLFIAGIYTITLQIVVVPGVARDFSNDKHISQTLPNLI